MTMIKYLIGGAGFAALAAAAPAAAQYQPYGSAYGYGYNNGYYGMNTQAAVNSCSAAVQNRLAYRTSNYNGYYGGYNGGYNGYSAGRVLSVASVTPRRNSVRVTGLATSGRMTNGVTNLFGLLGSNYRADLSFGCTVDYRGRITDIDINRR